MNYKTITRITERTYKPTENPVPQYKVERCITTRKYILDVISPTTGEVLNHTTLYWKHDTNDTDSAPVYHGCSYRFAVYNPTPVTDWFHGVPIGQMLAWCEEHNLVNARLVAEFKNITYVDECVWDSCNGEWVKPRRSRR